MGYVCAAITFTATAKTRRTAEGMRTVRNEWKRGADMSEWSIEKRVELICRAWAEKDLKERRERAEREKALAENKAEITEPAKKEAAKPAPKQKEPWFMHLFH
jgi:hypothetical protein